MTITIKNNRYDSEAVNEMLKTKENSIVGSLKMTCSMCPEQYDVLDKYGNIIGYIRLRHGYLTVECPDCCGLIVYENTSEEDGCFMDDETRANELSNIIDAIDAYYQSFKLVEKTETDSGVVYSIAKRDDVEYNDTDVLEKLYEYESTNCVPSKVNELRSLGPVINYKQCITMILDNYYILKDKNIRRELKNHNLSDECIRDELRCIRYTDDYGVKDKIDLVNWLFDKSFNDFEEIFWEMYKHDEN